MPKGIYTHKPLSETHRRNIGKAIEGNKHPLYGKHHSEETKQKIRDAHTKQNPPMLGKHHSEKTRIKISMSKKGKPAFWLKGKHLSEERKKQISKFHLGLFLGEKHPNWQGGISFFPYSPEWTKELKQATKNRDNNECQNPYCDHKSEKLMPHHINYNKQDCSQFNLITLCNSCNSKANINRREWQRFYKKIIWSKY